MKLFLFIGGFVAVAAAVIAQNQTNGVAAEEPPAAATNGLIRASTEIFSDSGDFNLKTHVAVYAGNVRVVDPQMKLTCELLTAVVPEGGGRVNHIVAETNVVIDAIDTEGRPIHATSGRAVYNYKVENGVTNETILLTIHPEVKARVFGSAETILWDRVNNKIYASGGQHTEIRTGGILNAPTNAAPASNSTKPAP